MVRRRFGAEGYSVQVTRGQVGHGMVEITDGVISATFSQGQEIPPGSNVFWPEAQLLVKPMTVSQLPISGKDLDPGRAEPISS